MEKSFRNSFLFSLFVHFLLFYFTSRVTLRKVVIGPLPIELIRISLPASLVEVKPVSEKKKEEIVLPKKEKKVIKKKEEVKKEEPEKPKETAEEKKIVPALPTTALPSSGVSIESAKFHYTYYLNLIREKVGKNWSWPTLETRKKTIIYFRILKDGSVNQVKTKESSKDDSFDLAALRAIEISAPFPPLPAGFPEEYLGVYFEFSFQ
ncbi:MAG TPA: hypothetical protein DHV62_10160 [Elusimicrobia bacterium]|jgi:TonB family protein|nr:hypothetical protein [Elusimicrobiota bacterium]